MRRPYGDAGFDVADLRPTWLAQFLAWLGEAQDADEPEPNAMTFATADRGGRPSARTVLLKAVNERGFVLYTNLQSRKGREATENPWASLVFAWLHLRRQVIVRGAVEPVPAADSDEYFALRPRGAQLSALVSQQSQVIADRAYLDAAWAQAQARYPAGAAIPRPANWGGLRVVPDSVEFWQGRRDRLHDRLRFRLVDGREWAVERLAP